MKGADTFTEGWRPSTAGAAEGRRRRRVGWMSRTSLTRLEKGHHGGGERQRSCRTQARLRSDPLGGNPRSGHIRGMREGKKRRKRRKIIARVTLKDLDASVCVCVCVCDVNMRALEMSCDTHPVQRVWEQSALTPRSR